MFQPANGFVADHMTATGAWMPQFVRDEFDAFLECGILAHGFLRLRCGACGHDELFSCRRCGFCPSCGARVLYLAPGAGGMAHTVAHLVDHVLPHLAAHWWQIDCRKRAVRGCRCSPVLDLFVANVSNVILSR
jgi:hypothetical protein